MLIEQNVEFELRGPEPPGNTCISIPAGKFHDKTKISKEKSSRGLLFTAKTLQEAMYFTSPYLGK